MKTIIKLPKEVIDFYKQNATILVDHNSGNKYMFLPLWIGSHNEEKEVYELIHLENVVKNKELSETIERFKYN